ncbi:MAG TPA: LCP family protein [Anaerolineaceae bacterium]|nr:LCP family protein [Anaerolineaceae bacterium]
MTKISKPILWGCLVILLAMMACNFPIQPASQSGNPVWSSNPNATVTPTPFQPMPPTPAGQDNLIILPTVAAGQLPPNATPIPPGTQNLIKILILGSDMRQTLDYRTDVFMLLLINPQTGTLSVVSFPRDLYVEMPGFGTDRINTAMEYGGFELAAATLEYNFGIRPDYYMLTNFRGFTAIVDNLGGIDVNAAYNLTDECKLPQAYGGYCSMGPGWVHMDGQTALWYVRSRYSTSDFDRGRRSQEVMEALFNRLMSLDAVSRIPELYQIYQQNVDTNIPLDTVVTLGTLAPNLATDPTRIHRYAIGSGEVYPYMTPGGAAVLLPNFEAIQSVLQQAILAQ